MKFSMTASTMAYLSIENKGYRITCEHFMLVDDRILSHQKLLIKTNGVKV